jgi:hypothetical protein
VSRLGGPSNAAGGEISLTEVGRHEFADDAGQRSAHNVLVERGHRHSGQQPGKAEAEGAASGVTAGRRRIGPRSNSRVTSRHFAANTPGRKALRDQRHSRKQHF